MPAVEGLAVDANELAHSVREIGVGRFQQQVVEIAHQTVGMAEEMIPGDDAGQHGQEPLAVGVVGQERLAPVAPGCDMIAPARKLKTKGTCHGPTLASEPPKVQDVRVEIRSAHDQSPNARPDPKGGDLCRSI